MLHIRKKWLAGSSVFALAMALALANVPGAHAETLPDVLALAYTNNPALAAERAKLRSVDEAVPEALSGWRPNLTAEAEAGPSHVTAVGDGLGADTNLIARDAAINLSQPLYRGGRTVAATEQAEQNVAAERARLIGTEQSLLVDTATAYLDVLSNQAVLNLNVNNEHVLKEQLDATRERFRVGELTETDVRQSESRLARASADRSSAEGRLNIARETYQRLVGQAPGDLEKMDLKFTLPESRDAAITKALGNNPLVTEADSSERAADANIKLVRGSLLPELSLQGVATKSWDEDYPLNELSDEQILAQIKIPLYTSGSDYARLRAAYEQQSEARMRLDEAKREAEELAGQAWEQVQTAEAEMAARAAQIKAAQIALEGVRQEEKAGTRTILDTLDAEQEYLDAQVGSIQAERDRAVSIFQMLAAVGDFTAQKLALKVDYYDPTKHYDADRNSWIGLGGNDDAQGPPRPEPQ